MRQIRYLAAVGDANDVSTWSGIPYHLLEAARALGVLDVGLPLDVSARKWRLKRAMWNALQHLRGRGIGGYQYSEWFLEDLWKHVRKDIRGGIVLNCFQLYPRSILLDPSIQCWMYIDQTLTQQFDYYGTKTVVSSLMRSSALAREREGYLRVRGIIAHSGWAAQSIIEDYQIDPAKVRIVVPGANLQLPPGADQEGAPATETQYSQNGRLKLIFVGKDARRKGLDRLIRALLLARAEGAECTLSVVGADASAVPEGLRSAVGVTWLGFIDKRRDASKFLRLLKAHDVGCLLSRAEAGGIGLREYHLAGLAVLGPDTGGAPDHMIADASIKVSPQAEAEEISSILLSLCANRAKVEKMKAASRARCRELTWEFAAKQISQVLECA